MNKDDNNILELLQNMLTISKRHNEKDVFIVFLKPCLKLFRSMHFSAPLV